MTNEQIVQYIMADCIDDPATTMRSSMDREELWELAEDIKKNGLINPITVRPHGDRFEVVAGHRRFTACKMAAIIKISCVVRDVDDAAAFAIMASENLKRTDVNPVDEADFISKISTQQKITIEEIAGMIGRSIAYVQDRLTVGSMPDYLKEHLKLGQIKLGAALALNQITDDSVRRLWIELAVRDGVSVRTAEYWLYGWKKDQLPGVVANTLPPLIGEAVEYKPPMAECAVDGQEYPMSECDVVFVFKGNIPVLGELRLGMKRVAAETEHSPVNKDEGGAPLGA